jgi:L-threonylcarbamoyladenylate synthase
LKTIELRNLASASFYEDVLRVLQDGGLVCLPCKSSYRIVTDLGNEAAVSRLLQSKRRTRKAPSLVFISGPEMLKQVTRQIDPVARKLAERFWPGNLTLLFPANPELPAMVIKELAKANGKLGVRAPEERHVREIVSSLGRPILVSSANRAQKTGAASPAQIRKNFAAQVDLFLDAGDLPSSAASTVVDIVEGKAIVTRAGAITQEQLDAVLA